MTPKNLFLLTWKRALIIFISELAFIILHNLTTALLGIEEAIFLILAAVVLPIYTALAVIYSLIYFIRKKLKK